MDESASNRRPIGDKLLTEPQRAVSASPKPNGRITLERPQVRISRWKATARLMSTVAEMRKKEQCYLMQAIEIIRINPFVRRICAEAMEHALTKHPRGGGSHALLLVGTKLLALYSVPNVPDLQSADLFLLGLFVQDVLGREEVPGLEIGAHPASGGGGAAANRAPANQSPAGGGGGGGAAEEEEGDVRRSRTGSGSVHEETFYNSREGGGAYSPDIGSGGEEWADARSSAPSPQPARLQPPPFVQEPEEEFELQGMRRECVFLHTPSNNYAPYASISPSFRLHFASISPPFRLRFASILAQFRLCFLWIRRVYRHSATPLPIRWRSLPVGLHDAAQHHSMCS
jgi:hypothetical protein